MRHSTCDPGTAQEKKKKDNRNCLWEGPGIWFNKDLKVSVINLFKELKGKEWYKVWRQCLNK